jgi:Na+-driven multidrug efflux pump
MPLAYALGLWMDWGLTGIWIALCAELCLRGLLFLARFRSSKWETISV